MPRAFVFNTGRLFVGVDPRGAIRDVFFPEVAMFSHLAGHAIRFGVWREGRFAWLSEHEPRLELSRTDDVGHAMWELHELGLNVRADYRAAPDSDAFHVEFRTNLPARIFVTEDLRIRESDIGDTAVFDPELNGVCHYKEDFWFLYRFSNPERPWYATGIKGFAGLEGTWRDAEDGELSGNPIAQGSVDATLGVAIEPDQTVVFQIAAARSHEELTLVPRPVPAGPLRGETLDRPHALSEFSLKVIEDHTTGRGAMVAACDSDIMSTNRANYGYVWPRDAARVAGIVRRCGRPELAERLLTFLAEILPDSGRFLQKYHVSGTLGASWHPWVAPDGSPRLPIQEDETATTVAEACELVLQQGGETLLPMIRRGADFLASYRDGRGLPLPSYDLWEERWAVHAYTVGEVVRALEGAARVFAMDDQAASEGWTQAVSEVRAALADHLVDKATGRPYRSIGEDGRPDPTPDASLLLLPRDLMPCGLGDLAAWLRKALWVEPVGGLARYPGDYYFRRSDTAPGNPWVICTMWLAQAYAELAERDEVDQLLEWTHRVAGPTLILPEQIHAETGEHLSVSPLVWSHAEVLETLRLG